MFENYVGAKSKGLPQWAIAVIGAAIAMHVVLIGALVIKSFWTIHKLPLPETEVTFGAPPPPPPPPPAGSKKKTFEKKSLTKVKETVQVDKDKPKVKPDDASDSDNDDGVEGGVEGGVKGGVVGGVLGGVEGGVLGGTGSGPPPPPKKEEPKIVPQRALEASRISGTTQIQPPNDVNVKIRRAGKAAVGVFKMCLTSGGSVKSVRRLKSTGYPKYDSKLTRTMRTWRYRPFRVNGRAVPVCTSVTFIYKPNA
jgi:protein TonB